MLSNHPPECAGDSPHDLDVLVAAQLAIRRGDPSDEPVGIENDHRSMSHAPGSITGAQGSSKYTRLPRRRARAAAASSGGVDGGPSSAITWPRQVTRM